MDIFAIISSASVSHWALQTIAMMVTAFLIPRLTVDGPLPAFATVVVLAFVNAHVWDAALFFRVPDNVGTKTALLLLTNGVLFWIVVKILPGIDCQGIFPALIAPVVFTVVNLIIEKYGRTVDWWAVGQSAFSFLSDVRGYFNGIPPNGVTFPDGSGGALQPGSHPPTPFAP